MLSALALLAVTAAFVAAGGALVIPPSTVAPYVAVAAALLLLSALVRRSRPLVRVWIPFVILYLCYRALRGLLLLIPDEHGRHALLRAADEWLLGESPAWAMAPYATPWLTELMSYAYATMFILPMIVLVTLSLRGQEQALRRAALALLVGFYLGFVVFLLVPAKSPDIVYTFDRPLSGHGFYEASSAAWIRLQQITFDAFPSMHTCVSTLALVHARRFGPLLWPARPRTLFILFIPCVLALQLATMYLRQHYFVDVLAGWALAAVSLTLATRIESRWHRWAARY